MEQDSFVRVLTLCLVVGSTGRLNHFILKSAFDRSTLLRMYLYPIVVSRMTVVVIVCDGCSHYTAHEFIGYLR